MVVCSKWDITTVDLEEVRGHMQRVLRQRPPVIAVSAKTHRGVIRLMERVEELFGKYTARVSTGELNRVLAELREARQPPGRGNRRLNLLYGAQVQTRPPKFRLHVNDHTLVTRDYGYWVENELRKRFDLQGVPVDIDFVGRS
jgi:GTP-binding protein